MIHSSIFFFSNFMPQIDIKLLMRVHTITLMLIEQRKNQIFCDN